MLRRFSSKEHISIVTFFGIDDGSDASLRNVSNHLHDYTMQQPRRHSHSKAKKFTILRSVMSAIS
jgi:hypothetical protein